jgi:hypothetical protein
MDPRILHAFPAVIEAPCRFVDVPAALAATAFVAVA